ncbi:CBO0543 family protein [Mesobacillus harenae]|uniref:CBO0543 family protein n=1 Tax=Mesobacillus harenae TaxID=2213203 RepID=UPI001580BE45|nr:CBO0543 family protein [Mesobacillus harenae]
MKIITDLDKAYELADKAHSLKTQVWLDEVIFSFQWWTGLFLTVIPWIIWIILSKKESKNRFLYTAFLLIIISSFFDLVGVQLGLWRYYYEVIPFIPSFVPYDWTLIPVIIISLIEYKPKASPYIKGFVFAFVTAFIGSPIFEYFHFYKRIDWEIYYSFPIYFLIYLFGFWASKRRNFDSYW